MLCANHWALKKEFKKSELIINDILLELPKISPNKDIQLYKSRLKLLIQQIISSNSYYPNRKTFIVDLSSTIAIVGAVTTYLIIFSHFQAALNFYGIGNLSKG